MLDEITPVILTFNEENNIARTMSHLKWAKRVVVVDSFSTDKTIDLLRSFPNAEVFQRTFDDHASQWNFALEKAGTNWVLALDADYQLSDGFAEELRQLVPRPDVAGYRARFVYAIGGHRLRGSLYPDNVVLFRRTCGSFIQDGHTQRLAIRGAVSKLSEHIVHDDRKPTQRWLMNQVNYMKLERDAVASKGHRRFARRFRRIPLVAPLAVLAYTLFVKGTIIDGWPGIRYASERCVAEFILTLFVLENKTTGEG
jgi:glycosyltransferase involved in cell wall biosynthesis